MKDFYSMGAFFADINQRGDYRKYGGNPVRFLPYLSVPAESAALSNRLETAQRELERQLEADLAAEPDWEDTLRASLDNVDWTSMASVVLDVQDVKAKHGTILTSQGDSSYLASGPNPGVETYEFTCKSRVPQITGFQLEALPHESLVGPHGRLSRGSGNIVLTHFEVLVKRPGEDVSTVKLVNAVADFSQAGHPVTGAISKTSTTSWAVYPTAFDQQRTAIFYPETPVDTPQGTVLTIRLVHDSIHVTSNIGRPRLSVFHEPSPQLAESKQSAQSARVAAAAEAIKLARAGRTPEQQQAILHCYQSRSERLVKLRNEVDDATKARAAFKAATPAQKMVATVAVAPRISRILPRGNWQDKTGEVVTPAVPAILPKLATKERPNRLDLAKWLCSEDNPLAARAFVNRLWTLYFGNGLTNTPEEFGSQGEYPVNPQLIDYLSRFFIDSGWDIKQLIRVIVMTDAYKRQSNTSPEIHRLDPSNRYLTRQSIIRLPAEFIRDNGLIVSGLLYETSYGPSVFPYQPVGYWSGLSHPVRVYQPSSGNDQHRKGLYTYWQRTFLHPFLKNFDAPSREEASCKRVVSNTPIQALNLLNDPTFLEISGQFAMRVIEQQHGSVEDAIDWAVEEALGRKPSKHEAKVLNDLYQSEYSALSQSPELITDIHKSFMTRTPLTASDAAFVSVARVITNLHEFLVRR
jgi:hypothetical protein